MVAGDLDGPFDAVLLTVKAMALEQAMADRAPAVGPDTAVLPVLNGMRHLDLLRDRFGARAAAGCVFKIATVLDDAGRVVQLMPLQDLACGELDGSASPCMATLDASMQGAGFDARLSPDIRLELWCKWVLLAASGAITCLMRGPIGQVASSPGGTAFARGLIDEVVAVATAEGHPPGGDFVTATVAQFTAPASTATSSMFRDMRAGRPLEADQILGVLLERGQRAGLTTPLLAAAYAHLCVYARQTAMA